MTPHYADPWLTVYHGDARAVMAEMEPESVHCVVTSPPYFGLRDYGTASWSGGDEACDHLAPVGGIGKSTLAAKSGGWAADKITPETERASQERQRTPYRHTCGKCGAVRQDSQLGLEPTPEAYVESMVAVFREVRRVLRADGTVWLNLGDSYASDIKGSGGGPAASTLTRHTPEGIERSQLRQRMTPKRIDHGLKPKDLVGIPWRVAFALQADGWYLRSEIIWAKPNPMPESVTDRPTKSHETIFLLTKSPRYYFDSDAVREGLYDLPRDAADVSVSRSTEQTGRVVPVPTMFGGTDDGMEGAARSDREGPRSQPPLRQDREGQGDEAQARYIGQEASPGSGVSADAGGARGQSASEHEPLWPSSTGSLLRSATDGDGATVNAHSRPVAGNPGDAIGDVRVLRSDDETDDGSRHAIEQGRSPHDGERRGGVQAVQLAEGRPTAGRNLRSVWTVATAPYPGAHFATFPPKLIEPCIKAGTSERGVCPKCGAPWVRDVEHEVVSVSRGTSSWSAGSTPRNPQRDGVGPTGNGLNVQPTRTTGWRPSCDHVSPLPPQPATILDPFAGSGTTGMVAQSLSRRAVLIDLSMDYLGQLMDRNRDIPLGLGA